MTTMKINTDYTERVRNALAAEQGRRTARIFDAEDVQALADQAEQRLEKNKVPKTYRPGVEITRNAGSVPNSYRYRAVTTTVRLRRGPSGWFLIGIGEVDAKPAPGGRDFIPEATGRAMIRARGFDIIESGNYSPAG